MICFHYLLSIINRLVVNNEAKIWKDAKASYSSHHIIISILEDAFIFEPDGLPSGELPAQHFILG